MNPVDVMEPPNRQPRIAAAGDRHGGVDQFKGLAPRVCIRDVADHSALKIAEYSIIGASMDEIWNVR